MPIRVDFTGVETGGDFELLPEGMYPATVFEIKEKVAKESGKPMLEFTFKLVNQNNRRMWANYSLQPSALWKLKSTLLALGIPPKKLEGELEFEPQDLLGRECILEVTIGTWNGKQSNEVKDVHAPNAASQRAIDKAREKQKAGF